MKLELVKPLLLGDEGEDVELLHFYLRKGKFYTKDLSSKFSHSTAVAVEEWQKSRNVPITGVIGDEDIKIINAELAPTAPVAATTPVATAAVVPAAPANANNQPNANTDPDPEPGKKMSPFKFGILILVGSFLLLLLAFLIGWGLTGNHDKQSEKSGQAISVTSEPTSTPEAEVTPGPTEEPKATGAPAQNAPAVVDNNGDNAADKAKIKELEDRLKKVEADKAKNPPASTPTPAATPKPTATPAPVVAKVPTVITGGSAVLGRTSVVINGKVNPNNAETSYWIEYGESIGGLQSTAMKKATGGAIKEISFEITGLTAGTEYKYRLVADNSKGTSHGEFKSFVTTAASTPAPVVNNHSVDDIAVSVVLENGVLKVIAQPAAGKSFPSNTEWGFYTNDVFSPQGWNSWVNGKNSLSIDYSSGTVLVKVSVKFSDGSTLTTLPRQYPQ